MKVNTCILYKYNITYSINIHLHISFILSNVYRFSICYLLNLYT